MTDYTGTRMTAAEYFELPETNTPITLIHGEVIVSPSPTPHHQEATGNVFVLLKQKAKERGGRAFIAPLDVYLDDENVPQPDVMYLAPDTRCIIEAGRLVGAPDLIVEVLSPGSVRMDKRVKFRLYERYSVREYWIVDALAQIVEVWQLVEGRFVLLDVYSPGETFESSLVGGVEASAIFNG